VSWNAPKFSILTYILLSLVLAISANAYDDRRSTIPDYLPPMPGDLSSSDPSQPVPVCPAKDEVASLCGIESVTAEHLFGEHAMDPWSATYEREDRCRLWWWAHQVDQWRYAPLTEWASLLKDGLMENVEGKKLFKILEYAPVPPRKSLNAHERPMATCEPLSGREQKALSAKLQKLNLKNLSGPLIKELVNHCLAFEVETAIWKRISTRIVSSYIIPVGDIYFMVVAYPALLLPQTQRKLASVGNAPEAGMAYSTVGQCPISKNPRYCVEEYLGDGADNINFGFPRGFTHDLKGLATQANLDTFFEGGALSRPLDLTLSLNERGELSFSYTRPDGREVAAVLGLQDGQLALFTHQYLCDVGPETRTPLVLRPLAYPKPMANLFETISTYTPSDFPQAKTRLAGGVEKGCHTEKSYSQWAADTANAAKHYAHHGMPIDSLYRAIAHQRFRGRIEAEDTPIIETNLTFGKWRHRKVEVPILLGAYGEEQGIAMIKRRPEPGGDNRLYQRINVDGITAHEIWYYENPTAVWAEKRKNAQAHIIVKRFNNPGEIYEQSVIARLVKLETTCQTPDYQKTEILRAMYALLQAAPLEKGNELVAKVFLAAVYESIIGKKLEAMSEFRNLEIDALTMTFDEFSERYLAHL